MPGQLITQCQSCNSPDLEQVFDAGFLPPVNTFRPVGTRPGAEVRYPAEVLRCGKCSLVQLGYMAPPTDLFPTGYSYRSGTTKALEVNFQDLAVEVNLMFPKAREQRKSPLIVDVGSNDGTLLKNFAILGWRVQGVEPTDARLDAEKRGIPTLPQFWDDTAPDKILTWRGKAKVVTACNVFAHTPDPNNFLGNVLKVLDDDGVFVVECHHLPNLLSGVQYDTVYHEHLRYYSLTSLYYLLEQNGLAAVNVKRIPTHGGSVRVYAQRIVAIKEGAINRSVSEAYLKDKLSQMDFAWSDFRRRVREHKYKLHALLGNARWAGGRIFAVGAPSRAVTLVNYCGLDQELIECVCEVPGSPKIGGYLPGTSIPVVDEEALFRENPDYALLLSWHLADELIPKLKAKGCKARFIVPLPEPRVVE